jgi:RNA polymerase sigma factor (sigma-70 family)
MEFCDRFYRDNKERVLAFLLHLTGNYDLARDLVQESFTRYLSRYGRDTGNLALLYTIARNTALDTFRKHRENQSTEKEAVSRDRDPEHRLIERQEFDKVLAAVRQLNDLDRQLISLLATGTFSYKEIGRMLDISEANVKVKVHRARLRLKEILADGES